MTEGNQVPAIELGGVISPSVAINMEDTEPKACTRSIVPRTADITTQV